MTSSRKTTGISSLHRSRLRHWSRGIEMLESRVLLTVSYAPLYSFLGRIDGLSPNSIVEDGNGNLYGSTFTLGLGGHNTIFEIPAGQTTPVTLGIFSGTNGLGTSPSIAVDSFGNVFAATPGGGDFGNGSIFEIDAGTHEAHTIYSFPLSGLNPSPTITVDSDGNLFGTTVSGGANSHGQVFEITQPGSLPTFSQMYAFTSSDGTPGRLVIDPSHSIVEKDKYFVTTSTNGSFGSGQILEILVNSSIPVVSLPANAGLTTLTVGPNHDLFGTTLFGGPRRGGTIFKIDGDTFAFSTLYTFTNGADGALPNQHIVVDSSEDVFGATTARGHGAIFELVAGQSNLTVLHTFNGFDGDAPIFGVVGDPAGTMYGITLDGGAHGFGTIYRLVQTPILPATHLVFTSVPPASEPAGSLGIIMVAIEDANGTIVTTDNSTVTLGAFTFPGGTHLGGTVSVDAINGVATFTGLTIAKAGNYTLEASDFSLASAISDSFTLSPSSPTQLVFTVESPTTGRAGAPLTPDLEVAIEDKLGNVVTTDNSMVTIGIGKGSAGTAFANGTLSVQAVNGVATFNDLVLDTAGRYTLIATDSSLKAAKSKKITVVPDLATTHLVMLTAPAATAVVGKRLTPLVAALKDQFGNPVKSDTNATVTILSGPIGGTLGGTTIISLSKGTATLKSLTLSNVGNYTLQIADSSIINGTNAAITFDETVIAATA